MYVLGEIGEPGLVDSGAGAEHASDGQCEGEGSLRSGASRAFPSTTK